MAVRWVGSLLRRSSAVSFSFARTHTTNIARRCESTSELCSDHRNSSAAKTTTLKQWQSQLYRKCIIQFHVVVGPMRKWAYLHVLAVALVHCESLNSWLHGKCSGECTSVTVSRSLQTGTIEFRIIFWAFSVDWVRADDCVRACVYVSTIGSHGPRFVWMSLVAFVFVYPAEHYSSLDVVNLDGNLVARFHHILSSIDDKSSRNCTAKYATYTHTCRPARYARAMILAWLPAMGALFVSQSKPKKHTHTIPLINSFLFHLNEFHCCAMVQRNGAKNRSISVRACEWTNDRTNENESENDGAHTSSKRKQNCSNPQCNRI